MAKSYLETFQDSQEQMFAAGVAPLVAMGAMNSAVAFVPTGSNSTVGFSDGEITYNIQRMKRAKAGDTPAQTGAAGDDLISFYNTAKKVDFETISTTRGAERSIVFSVDPDEEVDFGAPGGHARVIGARTKSRLIEGEEKALASVVAAGADAGTLTASPAMVDTLTDAIYDIEEISDEFKHYSENVAVLIHPRLAKIFADVQGTQYSMGTNTFGAGFKGAFMYNGITFIPHKILNSIAGKSAGVVGAIVMDMEAYANAGLNTGVTEFDDRLGGKRFVGHRYSELDIVVDPSRIKIFDFANTATAKVND